MNPAFPSHVLIVEDDVKIAAILNDYLVDAGFTTTRTTNGTDAVALVKKHGFDLMLLDLMLPGLDGIEVCKAVRQFSEIPIIMLTARGEDVEVGNLGDQHHAAPWVSTKTPCSARRLASAPRGSSAKGRP